MKRTLNFNESWPTIGRPTGLSYLLFMGKESLIGGV